MSMMKVLRGSFWSVVFLALTGTFGFLSTGQVVPSKKKPSKKPATKKPTKKPTKKGYKTSGFGAEAVAQLKRQLEERIGIEH